MKTVILPTKDTVIVDGVSHAVDCSALDQTIHVIEWNGQNGIIEYINDQFGDPNDFRGNQKIDDIAPYQSVIDQWQYIEDHPPPPKSSLPVSAGLVDASYRASLIRASEVLEADGKTYEAVKLLLKAQR